jgi:hypothetical protein
MSNLRSELSGTIKKLQEERGILDYDSLIERLKIIDDKLSMLKNDNTYTYNTLEDRIKRIEDVLSKLNFG